MKVINEEKKEMITGEWGGVSRFFCIVGGLVAIGGGLSLIGLKAASENSMLQSIANGIGWYFIGKGLFMMAIPFQVQGAIFFGLAGKDAQTPETHVRCPDCKELVLKEAKACKHCGCKLVPQT